jgi:two-component system, NarL family, nitrate/nitrite response regulator NarL
LGQDGASVTGTVRILLVDDHALFQEGVASILSVRDPEAQLCCVANSAEAEIALASDCFDLALLDIDLQTEDGMVVLARWRQRYPELKIVMLSAAQDPAQMRRVAAARCLRACCN